MTCAALLLTLGFIVQEAIDLLGGAVVCANDKVVVVHVENQVLALKYGVRDMTRQH